MFHETFSSRGASDQDEIALLTIRRINSQNWNNIRKTQAEERKHVTYTTNSEIKSRVLPRIFLVSAKHGFRNRSF